MSSVTTRPLWELSAKSHDWIPTVLLVGMRLADGMSKAAVAFLAKQLAAENTHTGNLTTWLLKIIF